MTEQASLEQPVESNNKYQEALAFLDSNRQSKDYTQIDDLRIAKLVSDLRELGQDENFPERVRDDATAAARQIEDSTNKRYR